MTNFGEKIISWRDKEVVVQIKRVKNLTLRILPPGKIVVSNPIYNPIASVYEFLDSKAEWIEKHLKIVESRLENSPDTGFDGKHIWYFGKCLKAVFKVDISRQGKALLYEDGVVFISSRTLNKAEREKAVQEFYKLVLKREAEKLFKEWESKLGYYSSRVSFRNTKSRWGSCNVRTRAIMLNSRLVYRPVACLEYVIVHELAHLYEASHGQRFKDFLGLYLPDWKERRNLLNNYTFEK